MRILNLYAGIGGNRALWGDKHEVYAVENNPKIAAIYQEKYPKDKVIIADAHEFLLEHFGEVDFIWSSPPCPTHSRTNYFNIARGVHQYPDMRLYQEIIFLQHNCSNFGKRWVVENVISYYEPLIRPVQIGRHFIWSNFMFPDLPLPKDTVGRMNNPKGQKGKQKANKKSLYERNMVEPELGKHILDWSQKEWHHTKTIFQESPTPQQ